MSDDTDMAELVAFLTACVDEDELWATEASRSEFADAEVAVPGGAHWRWEKTQTDEMCVPSPDVETYIGDGATVALRSKEMWPSTAGDLPQFAIAHAREVPTAVGGHIVRHDPARVLRAVEGKRRTLAKYAGNPLSFEEWPLFPLFNMAREYADRPGFQTWWAPDL